MRSRRAFVNGIGRESAPARCCEGNIEHDIRKEKHFDLCQWNSWNFFNTKDRRVEGSKKGQTKLALNRLFFFAPLNLRSFVLNSVSSQLAQVETFSIFQLSFV